MLLGNGRSVRGGTGSRYSTVIVHCAFDPEAHSEGGSLEYVCRPTPSTRDSRGNAARPQREARRQASLRPRRDCNFKLARWGRASTGAGWSRSCSTANGVQVVTVMPRTLALPATLNPGALSPPKQLILQNTGESGRPPPGKIGLPGAQGAGNGGIGPRAQLGRSP